MEKLIENGRDAKPALVVVDLHNTKLDPVAVGGLKSNEELRTVKLLGFFSHVHADLQRNAWLRVTIRSFRDPCSRAMRRYSLQRSRDRRDYLVNRPYLTHHLFVLLEC